MDMKVRGFVIKRCKQALATGKPVLENRFYCGVLKLLEEEECIVPEKLKPIAEIYKVTDEDGWHAWDAIRFRCPKCGRILSNGYGYENGCPDCEIFFDWGTRKPKILIEKTIEW